LHLFTDQEPYLQIILGETLRAKHRINGDKLLTYLRFFVYRVHSQDIRFRGPQQAEYSADETEMLRQIPESTYCSVIHRVLVVGVRRKTSVVSAAVPI